MWFMKICPSHFRITLWYWGAWNDSFWNVRVLMCRVLNNKNLLSLQLWPTLFCEMILWIQMSWGFTVMWKERALDWEWPWPVWVSSVKWKCQTKLSPSLVQLLACLPVLENHFRVEWDVLSFTGTRSQRGKAWAVGCRPECLLPRCCALHVALFLHL